MLHFRFRPCEVGIMDKIVLFQRIGADVEQFICVPDTVVSGVFVLIASQ